MIELIQTNILDNTDNQHLLTLKTTNFNNFMERVTRENINAFYNGCTIFHINPLNGNELGYKYIANDNNDIIVREYKVLIDSEYCGKITSLQEFEIIKDHYYFYTNEVDVIDTKIKWLEKEIKREQKLREFYLEYKDMDSDKLKECLWGPK